MNLYTYIFEFRKGTYITQVEAESVDKSVGEWLENLKNEKEKIYQLCTKSIQEISKELKDAKPLLLDGIQSVWCLSFTIKQGYGLVNIVGTEYSKSNYFKKKWLIDLLENQNPTQTNLITQLKEMKAKRWLKQPYIRFVNNENANQKGAEWQFEDNIVLEHKTEGTIVLDILKDGRIGGFELLNELD